MTLREKCLELAIAEAANAFKKSHDRNYHKLYILRDGSVSWSEFTSRSSDLIDAGADGFAPVPSATTVGSGSIDCDCDNCQGDDYDDSSDGEAVYAHREMIEDRFQDISTPYFADESAAKLA